MDFHCASYISLIEMFADSFSETLESLLLPLRLLPSGTPSVDTPLQCFCLPFPFSSTLCVLCPSNFCNHENPFCHIAFKEVWLSPTHSALPAAAAFDFGYKFILNSYRWWGQSQHSPSFASCLLSSFLHSSVTVAVLLRQLLAPFMYWANTDWALTSCQVLCCKLGWPWPEKLGIRSLERR